MIMDKWTAKNYAFIIKIAINKTTLKNHILEWSITLYIIFLVWELEGHYHYSMMFCAFFVQSILQ